MGWFDSALGGIGNLFGGAGNALMSGASGLGSALSSGFKNLFGGGGGGQAYGAQTPSYNQGFSGMTSAGPGFNVGRGFASSFPGATSMPPMSASSGISGGIPSGTNIGMPGGGGNQGGGGNWFSNMFSGNKGIAPIGGGLATLFGSQMVGNPGVPKLPQSFYDYQRMAQQGGPPVSQTGATAATGVLNTPFSQVSADEEGAATHALDLNYQEQLRQLQGIYHSLHQGTDLTTDTTYQRDLRNLNDQYARQKAETVAQLHRQAYNDYASRQLQGAGVAGNLGNINMGQQAAAIDTQVQQIAQQWQMSYAQQQALRQALMGFGGMMGQYGLGSLFPQTQQYRMVT